MNRQYDNELNPEQLAAMDQSPFTAEQLAGMNDETRTLIVEKQAYCRLHPVNAIYITHGASSFDGLLFSHLDFEAGNTESIHNNHNRIAVHNVL